jgi:hypothetical protein
VSQPGDSIVLILLIAFIIYLFVSRWVSWRFEKDWSWNQSKEQAKPIKGEVPTLLREFGYEPIEGKKKIPISIHMDNEPYDSRMFVDYLVMKESLLYVVIVARERKPLRHTGPAIRDYLFPTFLLFRPAGIVYVDKAKNKVSLVHFSHTALHAKKKGIPWGYVVTFCLGIIFMWLIQQ